MNVSSKIFAIGIFTAVTVTDVSAQISVTVNKQMSFGKNVPAGNYSGITGMGNGLYAVVSDKSEHDGYFVFNIDIDSISGEIINVRNKGFVASDVPNRDAEGITYIPERNTVLIVGERDSRIMEYDSVGTFTGRELYLAKASENFGYESLSYNENTGLLWTCTENVYPDANALMTSDTAAVVRLQSFNVDLRPVSAYSYRMDKPQADSAGKHYAHGISELLALDDGSLVVLEREFRVPESILGAYVVCKLYLVRPQSSASTEYMSESPETELPKELLCEWKTRLALFNYSLANYEGMCLGPKLADGSQTVVMVSDSQNREGGVLRDWFRTIIIRNTESIRIANFKTD